MSDDAQENASVEIFTVTGNTISLQSWLMQKLGATAGDRIFKDLVAFAGNATASLPGEPSVILTPRGGKFVSVHVSN